MCCCNCTLPCAQHLKVHNFDCGFTTCCGHACTTPPAQATATFVQQLASKHEGDCPWRSTVCAPELAAFPPLPVDTVRQKPSTSLSTATDPCRGSKRAMLLERLLCCSQNFFEYGNRACIQDDRGAGTPDVANSIAHKYVNRCAWSLRLAVRRWAPLTSCHRWRRQPPQ